MASLNLNGQIISLTPEGFLEHREDWNEAVAQALAAQKAISLTPQHWQVIYFLRHFHEQFKHAPTMRALINGLKVQYGEALGNSLTLQQLFCADSALKETHRIAGLAKPPHCT